MKPIRLLLIFIIFIISCSPGPSNQTGFVKIKSAVVTQKKDIAQLITIRYYKDFFMFHIENDASGNPDTLLAVIKRGYVDIGFDLGKMTEDDIVMRNDSIFVNICPPEALKAVFNQKSGIDKDVIYVKKDLRKSNRYDQIMSDIDKQSKERLENDAKENGLLEISKPQAERFFKDMFDRLKKPVVVSFKE